MRQNFDRLAGLIDKPVVPDAAERKNNLYQDGLRSRRKRIAGMDSNRIGKAEMRCRRPRSKRGSTRGRHLIDNKNNSSMGTTIMIQACVEKVHYSVTLFKPTNEQHS